MSFFVRGVAGKPSAEEWLVSFLESDLATSVAGRVFGFDSDLKVLETAKRGRAFKTLADHQSFASALEHGRGGVFLSLTDEEYRKLRG